MRTPLLPLASLALSLTGLHAQDVQWLRADPIDYALNPDLPSHVVCASDGDHVYAARTTAMTYLYDAIYGTASVERYDATGQTVWSVPVGDSVLVQAIASDADGRVIVGGRFFSSVHIGGGGLIVRASSGPSPESFLFALDADGSLLWYRNVVPAMFEEPDIASITFDPQGRAWYASATFFNTRLVRLNDDGSQAEVWWLDNAKTIGSISFDPWGGLYVSGGVANPGITINGAFFPVEPQYNFFVTRLATDGQAQWVRTAEDVTFQRPRVVADGSGHAYLIGSPADSLSWGGIHFEGPEWNSTFFLTRLDSTGHFDWGVQPPQDGLFSGQFELGHGETMGVDGEDNVYVLGTTSGLLDWGHGVIIDNGSNQNSATTLLKFDPAGIPQWELHSDSEGYDVPQGLSVLGDGTCHLGVQAQQDFTLGGHTVDAGEQNGLVIARIAPSVATGIGRLAPPADDLVAFPSPFDRTFTVSGPVDRTKPFAVRVLDPAGRLVAQGTVLHDLGTALRSGTYIVEVAQGGRLWRTRVVKR